MPGERTAYFFSSPVTFKWISTSKISHSKSFYTKTLRNTDRLCFQSSSRVKHIPRELSQRTITCYVAEDKRETWFLQQNRPAGCNDYYKLTFVCRSCEMCTIHRTRKLKRPRRACNSRLFVACSRNPVWTCEPVR